MVDSRPQQRWILAATNLLLAINDCGRLLASLSQFLSFSSKRLAAQDSDDGKPDWARYSSSISQAQRIGL